MNLFQIDKDNPIPKLELSLHRPNEEQVGSLTDTYDRSGTFSYGRYNELKLTVPRYVDRKHKRVKYKEFDLIRDKYLVKISYGNLFSEYMTVVKLNKSKGDGMPIKQVTMRSRQYELNGYTLKDLEALSYSPEEIIALALRETNWKLGVVDTDLIQPNDGGITPRRSFEESNITTLNLLYKVAEAFSGVLEFDTFNRTVSIHKPENAEIDMGLTAMYGKYIKSLDEDTDAESVITRMRVYGKDNMGINEVNPTGQSYIEDFSYYMQGYETDKDGNVVSSSPYMSDSLCQAIIDYNLLLIAEEYSFKNYLDELKPIQEEWVERLSELYALESDLEIIQDQLDIAKAMDESTDDLKQQKVDKKVEIEEKQSEIDELETQIQLIENDIKDLREKLSLENNFTPKQIEERNDYISYGEWSDSSYFDVNELYEKGKEVMRKRREPVRDLDLSLVQFLESIESKRDWSRIGLGYVIHTSYEPLDIEFKALITDLDIGFDDQTMGISISNVDYKSNKDQFLEMLYGTAISTADRVQSEGNKWSDNIDRTDYLAEFLENPWETSRQRIIAGVDETVDISRRGIIIRNPRFPNERLHATAGVLALSLDDGETWSTAISPYGVAAEVLIGKVILGEKLEIGDEEGTFTINGNLLTIKDRNEVTRLRLGEYSSNRFGLQLMNKTGKDVVLDENGILQTWQVGQADNVDPTHGLTIYLYLPEDTLSIRQARLNFRLLPFRSYAGTTEAGGANVPTSSSGGGVNTSTKSGGSSTPTSSSGGSVSKSTEGGGGGSDTSAAGGDHHHTLFVDNGGIDPDGSGLGYRSMQFSEHTTGGTLIMRKSGNGDIRTYSGSGNHTHSFTFPNHSHSFTIPNHTHSVTIPAHTHDVTIPAHTHNVTIPAHSHDIAHGIFVSTFARGVGVIINGINRTSEFGGKFNASQANIDIGHHLRTGEWNEIELVADTLGRVDGNVFIQAFMST